MKCIELLNESKHTFPYILGFQGKVLTKMQMQQVEVDYKVQPEQVPGSCLTMSEVHNLMRMQWFPERNKIMK